jgi:uncharacterized membrane protein YdfJ with MMPL/SSD domain
MYAALEHRPFEALDRLRSSFAESGRENIAQRLIVQDKETAGVTIAFNNEGKEQDDSSREVVGAKKKAVRKAKKVLKQANHVRDVIDTATTDASLANVNTLNEGAPYADLSTVEEKDLDALEEAQVTAVPAEEKKLANQSTA